VEETALEKILTNIFTSIKGDFEGRFYNMFWKDIPDKENNMRAESFPWFCATTEESSSFLESWTFFHRGVNKRIRTDYVVKLCFFALTEHCNKEKRDLPCFSNPDTCSHTIEYVQKFFTLPQKEQAEIVDLMIKNNLFADYITCRDDLINTPQNTLMKFFATPHFVLGDDGYFRKNDSLIYSITIGDSALKFPIKGRQILHELEEHANTGIERNKIVEDSKFKNLMKNFISEEYIPIK